MVFDLASKRPAVDSLPGKNTDPRGTLPPRGHDQLAINEIHRSAADGTPTLRPGQVAYLQSTWGNSQVSGLMSTLSTVTPTAEQRQPGKAQPAAGRLVPELRVGGAVNSKKIVRIGWTFDDGPTRLVTEQMQEATRGIPSTWYIMRNQIEAGDRKGNLAALKKKQDLGQEIAIHSMHRTESHVAWFPGGNPSYGDIRSAMKDLREFNDILSAAGIRVHFVRLPGGVHSELMNYLAELGMDNKELRNRVARDIIAGHPMPPITKSVDEAERVKMNFEFMKSELAALGLHEWGGAGRGKPEVGAQGWEAESEPPGTNLTDDIIKTFRKTVDVTARDGQWRSLVILAHDTAVKGERLKADAPAQRVMKVGQDLKEMENYASDKGVRIEYFRMSDLYRVVRGEEP